MYNKLKLFLHKNECGNFGFLLKNACSEIKIASLRKSKCKIWKADITHHIFALAERKIFLEYLPGILI